MKKLYRTIFVVLIIQIMLVLFSISSICLYMPVVDEDIYVANIVVQSVRFKRVYSRILSIEDQSKCYIVPGSHQECSTTEISNLISEGDIVSLKYIKETELGVEKNIIVEMQDDGGNFLRTLEGFNAENHKSRNWIIFLMVLIEIIFISCCVTYILYCKYILGISFIKHNKKHNN